MSFPLRVAATAFAVHSLVPAFAAWIWRSNGNEAGLGALIVVSLADFPLIPLFARIADGRGDAGVAGCLWTSLFLGGVLYAAVATGLAVVVRRAMRR